MMDNKKEEKLRKIIRSNIRETLFGDDFSNGIRNKDSEKEELGSYNSSSTKIIFYKESDEDVCMKVLNKITGNMSGKIYLDNVEEFLNVLDYVNIIR